MARRKQGTLLALVAAVGSLGAFAYSTLRISAQQQGKTEEVTIYRDEFGIPNIFADTEEGAVYGMGYAQAEDWLEEILKQYRRAEGTMAEVFGPDHLKDDYRQRVWQHRAISEARYSELSPKVRAITEAYQAGLGQYMAEHPTEVPGWAPKLEPWQIIALGRSIIWGWPEGDAAGDLKRGGIEPDPVPYRGSNEWVITPSRTADGFALALFCPMVPSRYVDRPYLYNADNPLHQRAAMALELLDLNSRVTIPEAIAIAMSPQVYNADLWQARLVGAWEKAESKIKDNQQNAKLYNSIVHWNRRLDPDSTGAIAYRYWKDQLGDEVKKNDRAGRKPPKEVTDDRLLQALTAGAAELIKQWGRPNVQYGDVYRVGRQGGDKTWPVGGGSVEGIATPRAISFDPITPEKKMFLGRGGQTSTQVVQMTNPPRSWTVLPLGESDHRDSKHWDDQAEKLFSRSKIKPTYFLNKDQLLKHVESKKVLQRPI